jgi:hypothetical protein
MRPWVLTRPYLNKYCLVSRPVEYFHGPQIPSRTLEFLVALLVQTQHVTIVVVLSHFTHAQQLQYTGTKNTRMSREVQLNQCVCELQWCSLNVCLEKAT